MYLIHASLKALGGAAALPSDTRALVLGQALPEERVEHVSVHAHALPHPVLGLYLLSDRLLEAEATARALCLRALLNCHELSGWTLLAAQAPLAATAFEQMLSGSRPPQGAMDGKVQGPFGPPGSSSGAPDQRRK
ncbi:hypothetical protein AB0B01_11595 [Streptomyces sp. NPDC044571]|uniref:hypothetical protein n=1 Tax=Streptomyces sp. NPDC044571 TaxID=3155371 RepID=UPI0034003CC6